MKVAAGTTTICAELFAGDVRMQGCSLPLPKVARPDLMRVRDAEWIIESTWAEHNWPSGGTALLRRHRTVLHALGSDESRTP